MKKQYSASERKRKFDSKVLEDFYYYLLEERGMSELACYDYCRRIVRILNEEEVIKKLGTFTLEDLADGRINVQDLIGYYSKDGMLNKENTAQHGAPSAALKKFKEFLNKANNPNGGRVLNWMPMPTVPTPKRDRNGGEDGLEEEEVEDEEEEYEEDNLSDKAYLQERIFLRETEGEMPFEIKVKHCSQIEIHNSDCTVIYKENGAVCNTVHKVISPKNYADLIRLMRRYHSILNNDHLPASIAVPFGGAHTYEYEFGGKSNYSRSHKLFNSSNKLLELQAYDEYNKIIANIIKE